MNGALLEGQVYNEADPFNLLRYEKTGFEERGIISPYLFRPSFYPNSTGARSHWSMTARAEYFENEKAKDVFRKECRSIS